MADAGGEGGEDGDLSFGRSVAGRDGDGGGYTVEEEEALREFEERDQMAHSGTGQQHKVGRRRLSSTVFHGGAEAVPRVSEFLLTNITFVFTFKAIAKEKIYWSLPSASWPILSKYIKNK